MSGELSPLCGHGLSAAVSSELARISHTPCGLRCASRLRPTGYDGPSFLPAEAPAKAGRRGRYGVGRRGAYQDIRLSRPTPEMPAERQPEGPVEEADRVRLCACPMR